MTVLKIRPATIDDTDLILRFVRELARYEKAEDQVMATPEHIHRTLFCDNPRVYGLICLDSETPIGFAVYFFNYSTWQGQHGLYLEDIYVSPGHRNKGAGTALLQYLAGVANANDCGRFEWSVLDWNTPSLEFYDNLGAARQSEWIRYRVTGQKLKELASGLPASSG